MSLDLKDAYFYIEVVPHHKRFLRFALKGWHFNTRSYHLGCPWLPRRLSHSGPVRGGFDIAQDPPNQLLSLPGDQGQFCQEHTVTQPTSFIPGHSYRLSADDSNCLSGASHDDSTPRGFLQGTKRAHFSTALLQMLCRQCKTCRTPLHAAWVAYQYKVLPFGLSLAPRTFTQCMDAAFSPLRQMTVSAY